MAGSAPQSGRSRWTILGLLMALCFISHFNRASITTAADERIMTEFGISTQKMGLIYSAYLLIYTIFMIPGGLMIDRWGVRRTLLIMGLGSAAFGAATGVAGWAAAGAGQLWLTLLVVRSCMGLFTTPLHPGCARAVNEWFSPGQQSFANGLVTCAALLAYACVHPVFGRLIDEFNWPAAFIISAVVAVGIAALWFFYTRAGEKESAKATQPLQPRFSFGELLGNRSLILLTLSYASVGYFQYLFFYWIHFYFESVLYLGKSQSRYYAALPSLAMAVCMPIGGWLTGLAEKHVPQPRWARALVPGLSMLHSAVLLWAGMVSRDTFWVVLFFTASLAVLGFAEGAFWTTAVRLGGQRGGATAAIMNTGGNGIGLLAPALTPLISEHFGWRWGLGMGCIVAVLGALCWLGIDRRPTRVVTVTTRETI